LKCGADLIFSRQTMKTFILVFSLLLSTATVWPQDAKPPVHVAIFGLVHDHAYGFIPLTRGRPDVQLVGIVEPDQELAARYAKRFNLDSNLFNPSLDALLAKTNVDAVAAFTTTLDHRRVVEMCAPLHIDVMMEKPLAVNMQEALAIQAAAKSGGIQVIVNYETTWYPANQTAYKIVNQEHAIGDLRKIVAHDGHRGPREIGCSETFLKWLTDPTLNGGGALPDFGCYGADLMTWLMDGQRPTSVFAVTQQIKPEIYPKVEDEATVVLTYPKAQGIIQASWNWPFDRKDIEIYGKTGYVLAPRRDLLRVRKAGTQETEMELPAPPPSKPQDQLTYLVSVVRGEIQPSGLSCLDVNLTVTEILDAARDSAQTGRRIDLPAARPQ
jgi:predicted dehydrogenase